jgi:hypothetical protein
MAEATPKTDPPKSPDAASAPRDNRVCPRCGSTYYRRSRRNLLERLFMGPKMARCKTCDFRFPYPPR